MIDLGTLPGFQSSGAIGMNNNGQIVGYSQTASGAVHAFLYTDGEMKDLNELIDPSLALSLWDAEAINDNGQIWLSVPIRRIRTPTC